MQVWPACAGFHETSGDAMSRASQIRVVSAILRTAAGSRPCSTAYSFIELGAISTRRRSRVERESRNSSSRA